MKLKSIAILGVASALNFAAVPAHATNIVTNPGFEDPDLAGWTSNGWAAFDLDRHSGSGSAGTPCVGAGCVDESQIPSDAFLYQDLPTAIGATYTLTFWFAGDGTPAELKVFWGGSKVLDLLNNQIIANSLDLPETQYVVNGLVATNSSTRLMFLGRQDPGVDALDDVDVELSSAVSSVPEPATIAVFGAALAGAFVVRRRKAKA